MKTNLLKWNIKDQEFFSWTFLLIIIGYLLIQLPFLTDMRPILVDEPVYSSSVYNFLFKDWYIRTTMGSGGSSNFLLPLLVALSFKIFGISLFSARIVAVLSGMFFLYGLRRLFLYLKIEEKHQLFAFLTVIVTSHFVSLFRYVRPECLSVTFLLFSVLYFVKYFKEKESKHLVLVAVFLLLSFLSHPFSGVFFALYGLYFLSDLYRTRKFRLLKYIIIFSLIAILAVIILFLANVEINKLPLNSLVGRTTLSQSSVSISDRISVFVNFWFLSNRVIFSIPFILLLIHGLFIKERIALIFSVFGITYLLVALVIFGNDRGMTTYIFNYSILFSVLLIPFSLKALEKLFRSKYILIIILAVYFTVNLGATVYNNLRKYEKVNSSLEADLKTFIPNDSYVLGPVEFWFSLPHTFYISYFHLLNLPEETRNKVVYIIVKEKDFFEMKNYGYDLKDQSLFEVIYSLKDTKSYGNVVLYKKKQSPKSLYLTSDLSNTCFENSL